MRSISIARASILVALLLVICSPIAGQQVFETVVVASPFADGVYWYLREPLVWRAFDGTRVVVPAGFVTDFASIPRAVWVLMPKWEKYGPAAVVHDYLYWSQSVSRLQADRYILEAMEDSKVGRLKRRMIYTAVRLFGGFSWRANRRDSEAKKIRILTRPQYPTKAAETWEECRQRVKDD